MINSYHEYIHPEYLDPDLICYICGKPWTEPVLTPCQNTFCRFCIEQWLDENFLKCPSCPQSVLKKHLVPLLDQSILIKLEQIHVRCVLCGQTNLKRGEFVIHLHQTCPRAIVTCSTRDDRCLWIGLREEYETHSNSCSFQSLKLTNNGKRTNESMLHSNYFDMRHCHSCYCY
jgi:hypothetical protein